MEEEVKYTPNIVKQVNEQLPNIDKELTITTKYDYTRKMGMSHEIKPIEISNVELIVNPEHRIEYKVDIENALNHVRRARGSTKGNIYGLMARFLNGVASTIEKMMKWPKKD